MYYIKMTPRMILSLLICVAAATTPFSPVAVSVHLVSDDNPSSLLLEPQPKQRRLIQCVNSNINLDDASIKVSRNLWFLDLVSSVKEYCEIDSWGTYLVTSFDSLFYRKG